MINYHDTEYGFLVEDNDVIFERLMLEIYQAGLTWRLVLQRREAFNDAFHTYKIDKVASMTDKQLEKILENPDVIRNRLKINATRHNAQIIQRIISDHGSFAAYLKTLNYKQRGEAKEFFKPVVKEMKAIGFKFIGPLILEEFFKSIGFNKVKHSSDCFLFEK